MITILYLTDLYYNAKGRKYYEEDLFITSKLKEHFNILIGNPQQAISHLNYVDIVIFRNTGVVMYFSDYFQKFLHEVSNNNILTFNSFDGKADIRGKEYLLNLTNIGFPVIPTIDKLSDLSQLGNPEKYLIKIKNGADSIGMEILSKEELLDTELKNKLIQPYLDFEYEISFYYLNNEFQYALYAPDKNKRWELKEIEASLEDIKFADKFITWNNIQHGITRVDACRLRDNSLLLVELEDLNPFLSIELLSEQKQEEFISRLIKTLKTLKKTVPNTI
ncbi:hypothetical protein [Cellulophaga sp. Hel_I_12]|uniref:hypothetical protein n=1 Tax=Cellulophaga sp. Hel_I_12 TaxID=1249972 RepID=UPI0006492217|nr:hypothetical protein [Cellulophaga sp. Hel_I_12]